MAGTGFYLYLAYHNVHGATNDLAAQQAPQATVKLYNTTKLDTCECTSISCLQKPIEPEPNGHLSGRYKVAGAMITKLDDGVGMFARILRLCI